MSGLSIAGCRTLTSSFASPPQGRKAGGEHRQGRAPDNSEKTGRSGALKQRAPLKGICGLIKAV